MEGREIKILDTTLCAGERMTECSFRARDKKEIAAQLERLGVSVVETGFIGGEGTDNSDAGDTARSITRSIACIMCAADAGSIGNALAALKGVKDPMIHVCVQTHNISPLTGEEAASFVRCAVAEAKKGCDRVEFSVEYATRIERDFLLSLCLAASDAGAGIICIPDTSGCLLPTETYHLVKFIRDSLPSNVTVAVRCSNDLGMAVANSLSAVAAGAMQIEGTVNGIGERAGCAALEEMIMALRVRGDFYNASTLAEPKQIYRTCRLVSGIVGEPVAANKPIVGSGIYDAESPAEPLFEPAEVGVVRRMLALGRHTNRHAFDEHVFDMGYNLSDSELDKAYEQFVQLAERKKTITDRDIDALIGPLKESVAGFTLKNHIINSGGSFTQSTATVVLEREGEEFTRAAVGAGPVDAAFKAVDKISRLPVILESFSVSAVTEGEDALGEAVVKIRYMDYYFVGRGISPDVLESSVAAYVDAINKALASRSAL